MRAMSVKLIRDKIETYSKTKEWLSQWKVNEF